MADAIEHVIGSPHGPRRPSTCPASSTDPIGRCRTSGDRHGTGSLPMSGRRAPPDRRRGRGRCSAGLVAYNLWLVDPDLELARRIRPSCAARPCARWRSASATTSRSRRTSSRRSCSDRLNSTMLIAARSAVARAELVGLLPCAVLERIPSSRWPRSIWPRSARSRPAWSPLASGSTSRPVIDVIDRLDRSSFTGGSGRGPACAASGGTSPADPTTLPFAHASPDPELLALDQAYSRQSSRTTHPRQTSFASASTLRAREEQIGIHAETVRELLPPLGFVVFSCLCMSISSPGPVARPGTYDRSALTTDVWLWGVTPFGASIPQVKLQQCDLRP